MYINVSQGKKAAMPRYYKNKIYSNAERSEISGYQKGQLESKTLDAIANYVEVKSTFARDKKAAIKASFSKMQYQDSLREKQNR